MDVVVRLYQYSMLIGYTYNIAINNEVDVFLNNRKVTVKLLKLLGKQAQLYSSEVKGLRSKFKSWRET